MPIETRSSPLRFHEELRGRVKRLAAAAASAMLAVVCAVLAAPAGAAGVAIPDPPEDAHACPRGGLVWGIDGPTEGWTPLLSARARTVFSDGERMESRVWIRPDGHATVATRLSSRLPRPLVAEVTVAFLDPAGGRLGLVARTYRLAGGSARLSRGPMPRLRADAVQVQLDPAGRCWLARTQIVHRRLGGARSSGRTDIAR
jgi:hypothetical protein